MSKESRLLVRLKRHWSTKFNGRSEFVDRFAMGRFQIRDDTLSATEIIGACSLMAAQMPIYEILGSLETLANESVAPIFTDEFFIQFHQVILELERAGWREHSRKMRKLGHAIATCQYAKSWQQQWAQEINQKLESAIHDEPFLPQRGW